MKTLRIGVGQLNPTLNDFDGNASKILVALEALAPSADLVVFPELALSGYYPFDTVEAPGFLAAQNAALQRVVAATAKSDVACLIGLVTRNDGAGKPFFNSAAFIEEGEIREIFHKQRLASDLFDESRHFEPGPNRPCIVTVQGVRIGLLITAERWEESADTGDTDGSVAMLEAAAPDLIVSMNASPSELGKGARRRAVFAGIAERCNAPLLYVNQVGGQDQVVFDGASFAVNPDGQIVELPSFSECVATVSFDGARVFMSPSQRARLGDVPLGKMSKEEFYYRQIVLGGRDYARKSGFSSVVVGSSGGIDSALTLALAADMVGPKNVTAITMPGHVSSAGSVDDSVALCRNLGIRLIKHPITSAFDVFRRDFAELCLDGAQPGRLTLENLQARIRGVILMEYSNETGALLLATGNKSEVSVGYATLYGDMCGGLNLIGDLFKTQVYALARRYNAYHGRDVIPQAILDKEPSAELFEGQKDSDSLPPYPVLDAILAWHIEKGPHPDADPETLDRVIRMVERAEFKRRQAAPIIRLSRYGFGADRPMPMTSKPLEVRS